MAGTERQTQNNNSAGLVRARRSRSPRVTPLPIMRSASCACGGSCPRCAGGAPNNVSRPEDAHEREAAALSEQVVQMPEPMMSALAPLGGGEAPPPLAGVPAAVRATLRSAGTPLDPSARAYMEPRLGRDLSGVRVHRDSAAADSAKAIGANAYSAGNDVVFGQGRYEPHSDSGRRLLAHELVHVVQAGMAAGSSWAAGVDARTAPNAAPVPIQQSAAPAQLSRDGRPDWQIEADLAEVEAQLADPTLSPEEVSELQLRRDYYLDELGISSNDDMPVMSTSTAGTMTETETPRRSESRPARAETGTPPVTSDTSEHSGTDLEAEIAQLRADLLALPADESSPERDTIESRLAGLEAALLQRQALGQRSDEIARLLAASGGDLQTRISMAFGAGFAAGALMEFRPAEAQRFIDEISAHPFAFGGGIGVGIVEGALLGLWDNIVGLFELGLWLSPAYWAYLGISEAVDFVSDPEAYSAEAGQTVEQAQALMTGLGEFLAEVVRDPGFLVIHGEELGQVLGHRAAQWFNDDFMRRTPFEKGETVGILAGRILLEIALLFLGPEEWVARGLTGAGQVIRVSARMEHAVLAILERLPSLRRFLELRRAAGGGVRAVEETLEGARTAERLIEGATDTGRAVEGVSETVDTARDVERAAEGVTDTSRMGESAADTAGDASRAGGGEPPRGGDRTPEGGGPRGPRPLDDWELEMLRDIQEDLDAHPELDWTDLGYADQQAVLDAVMRHPRREELLTDLSLRLDDEIARVESGMSLPRESREMLSGAREWEGEARATADELGELGERASPSRFDWRTTEEELSLLQAEFTDLPAEGWLEQAVVREGEVVTSGRRARGSTVPERYHPGSATHPPVSLEAKNYTLDDVAVGEDPLLMQEFLERTADQARRRAAALPANAEQWIIIDLRGQDVSAATREGIIRDLVALSDGALQAERIRFLP